MLYLLTLPVALIALSVHEASHGYAAYKLGDPTARNFGRLTLNPLKHIDPIGFLCMIFFHIGWAKPVPINTRYFKKPRRDMAISAAAGPVSNIALAFIFALLLRIQMIFMETMVNNEFSTLFNPNSAPSAAFNVMSLLTYVLYVGVVLNIGLAIFNLIPIPPFDGSRVAYIFLPVNLYFKVMRYERIIQMAVLLLLFTVPFFQNLISGATQGLASLILWVFGLNGDNSATFSLNYTLFYVYSAF
jgi:Zn-dependent protease